MFKRLPPMDEDTLGKGLRQLKAPDISADFNSNITRALAQVHLPQVTPRRLFVRNMIAMSASFAATVALLQLVSASSVHYKAVAGSPWPKSNDPMLGLQNQIDASDDIPLSAWSSGMLQLGRRPVNAVAPSSHGV